MAAADSDWLDAKRAKPKGLTDATSCAETLQRETTGLINIAKAFGGTGTPVPLAGDPSTPLSRVVSITGSRVARFNASHGDKLSWLNQRLTQTFEAADSLDKSPERSKLTRMLIAIEKDLNALQSWSRHEAAPCPGATAEPPSRAFQATAEAAPRPALASNDGWQGKTTASWLLGGDQEDVADTQWTPGQKVKYLSDTTKEWIDAIVEGPDGSGGIAVSINGHRRVVKKDDLQTKLKISEDDAARGYLKQSTGPDPRILAIVKGVEPCYEKLDAIGAALRHAVVSGFAPGGYMLITEHRANLRTVLGDLHQACDDLDVIEGKSPEIREQRRAIIHKLDGEISEAERLDKHLEQLTQLFQMLRL